VRDALALVEHFQTASWRRGVDDLHLYIRSHNRLIRRLYAERPMVQCSWCDEHFPAEMATQRGDAGELVWCVDCLTDWGCPGFLTGTYTDTERDAALADIIEHGSIPVVATPIWVER
jgi:hypothetical protein